MKLRTQRSPQAGLRLSIDCVAVICVVPFREWANDFARYSMPFLPEM
ncbi:hypothetical protein OR207_004738 [Enterobacter hormaechei]|nr:hypothetical protein [Enterobacter hormaechei]EKS6323726.1 hypothetical protein [Enterobacter hormaechei]